MSLSPKLVTIDGVEFHRSVTLRCPNIRQHVDAIDTPSCACHPKIPQPCAECYAIEVLSRPVPWSFIGRDPQPGAAVDGTELPS